MRLLDLFGSYRLVVRSVLSEEKNLFIAALSETFPVRLMLQVTPWSASAGEMLRYGMLPWCIRRLVEVMQQGIRLTSPKDCHHKGIGHKLGCHRGAR